MARWFVRRPSNVPGPRGPQYLRIAADLEARATVQRVWFRRDIDQLQGVRRFQGQFPGHARKRGQR